MNVKNISQESQDFVAELQEIWGESSRVSEVSRKMVGRFVALNVFKTEDPKGPSIFSVATPRSTMIQKSLWEETSVGVFVSRAVGPILSTRQVVSHSVATRTDLKETLGSQAFGQWEKDHEGTDIYNLDKLAIPYKVGHSSHVVRVSEQKRMRVYNKPVAMVHAAGSSELLRNPQTIEMLCYSLQNLLQHPTRIV